MLSVNAVWRAKSNVPYTVIVSASNIYASNLTHPTPYNSSNLLNATEVATQAPYSFPLGNITLTSNVATYNLSNYYYDSQNSPLTYWISSAPCSNASVSGSTLTVQAANRGLVYNVQVSASNVYQQTTTDTVNVVELANTGQMSRGIVANWNVQGSMTIGPNPVSATSPAQYPLWIQTANANNVSLYTAGDITAFSDERFKADIEPIEDALDKVSRIGGYTFRRSDDERGSEAPRRAGVLAQELKAVLPEVIDEDPEGMMHVAYGNVNALLIEAIKELRGQQQELSDRVSGGAAASSSSAIGPEP